MRRPRLWPAPALVLVVGLTAFPVAPLRAQTAVGDSAEFAAWRQVQKEDIDGMRKKFMALAKAVPADKLAWRPMEGTRSFREVFAHIAAEGNTETAMFGRPLPAGSLADFDAEEARVKKLTDDQLIAVMDRAMQSLSTTLGGLSRATINTPSQVLRTEHPAPRGDDLYPQRPARTSGPVGGVCPDELDRAAVDQEGVRRRGGLRPAGGLVPSHRAITPGPGLHRSAGSRR